MRPLHSTALALAALSASFIACTVISTTTATPPPDTGDAAPDAPIATDAAGDASADAATTDGARSSALSGTLVFTGHAADAGLETHLFAVSLGATPFAVAPLATTASHWELGSSFAQDGSRLFFSQLDKDPASATSGFAFLVGSAPQDASNPAVVARCSATIEGAYCSAAQLGNDGDVWFAVGNQIDHAPAAGGGSPTTWFDPSASGSLFNGCGVTRPWLTSDGTRLVTMVYPYAGCLPDDAGASPAGLYVSALTTTGLTTPLLANTKVSAFHPFAAFNRAGDRVFYTGADDKLYAVGLDGKDPVLVVDHAFVNVAQNGLVIVNDAWAVASEIGSGPGAPSMITAYPFAQLGAISRVTITAVPLAAALTWRP